jgi:uncharacterized membrane protein
MDYLDRVGDHLRMPDDRRDEVLEEIAAHLDDAIDALMEEGLSIEQAEREAMARLGSPAELGDELRRTHQTTKRLLAAAGGGVWQGVMGGFTGYIAAAVWLIPVSLVLTAVVSALASSAGGSGYDDVTGLVTAYTPFALAGGAFLAGRRAARTVADRAWRRPQAVRVPVGVVGGIILAVLALLVPADHGWLSIILTLAIPFAFAAGAATFGGRADGTPWLGLRWPSALPTPAATALVVFVAGFAVAISISIAFPGWSGGIRSDDAWYQLPTAERWSTAGYLAVADRVVEAPEGSWWRLAPARRGWASVELGDPAQVVARWSDVRIEAWEGASPDRWPMATAAGATAPYLVIAVPDPATTPEIDVRVGQPGIQSYLLFVTGTDRATGIRAALEFPEGSSTRFHGSVIEWFAAVLAP